MLTYEVLPCVVPKEKEKLPIVALHGMLCDKELFKPFCSRLAAYAPVYLVDLPSHGLSAAAKPLTVPSMAEMLLTFLASLPFSRFLLLGHSLGGQVCMCAALGDKDKRIAGICILDISPVNYFDEPGPLPKMAGCLDIVQLLSLLASLDLKSIKSKEQAISLLVGSPSELSQEDAESALYLLKKKSAGGPLEWQMDVHAISDALEREVLCWALPDGATPFAGPLLLLRGSKSPWVAEERHKESIDKLFPSNQIKTVQGASHSPHRDSPEVVADMLKELLQDI